MPFYENGDLTKQKKYPINYLVDVIISSVNEELICENCGHYNSLSSLFCENEECGEDISHIPPTRVENKGNPIGQKTIVGENQSTSPKTIRMTGIRLVNTATGYEIDIPLEGGVLGRSGTIQLEHFQNSLYVSNQHAKIQLTTNGYVIIDLNSTNGTKINGNKITSCIEHPIPVGTRITLANLEYMVQEL